MEETTTIKEIQTEDWRLFRLALAYVGRPHGEGGLSLPGAVRAAAMDLLKLGEAETMEIEVERPKAHPDRPGWVIQEWLVIEDPLGRDSTIRRESRIARR